MFLAATVAQAQVAEDKPVINIQGKVFGGARQADVEGHTFVSIAAENFDVVIDEVFGGNDISGSIGSGTSVQTAPPAAPPEMSGAPDISDDCNVYISTNKEATGKHLFIGQLFGGGNGDYTYTNAEGVDLTDGTDSEGHTIYKVMDGDTKVATSIKKFTKPELSKVYLSLKGGTFGYVYGGGNAATVVNQTDIYINNKSEITKKKGTKDSENNDIGFEYLTSTDITRMGITSDYNDTYQFSRVFGGNNKAAMAAQPTWHLVEGSIENLYGGGNAGDMTRTQGISLNIDGADMRVHNVYGGCRKADVHHTASVGIYNGNIDYVYGGNDISGTVRQGTSVVIKSTINHDVYGGSNGSYLYTNSDASSDLYFQIPTGMNAAEALTNHRPNVPSTSVLLQGTAEHPVSIGGAVYCGGNSATLKTNSEFTGTPSATLTLGSYVKACQVFMGCNGEDMVKPEALTHFSSALDLKTPANMAKYMEGVEMQIKPSVNFANPYSAEGVVDRASNAHIGEFYCGGNVGSVFVKGKNEFHFSKNVFIHEKLVGGCNNAYVAAVSERNAEYKGGMIEGKTVDGAIDQASKASPKVQLNLTGLRLEPRKMVFDENTRACKYEYSWTEGTGGSAVTQTSEWFLTNEDNDPTTKDNLLKWGNVYGGCFNTGYVMGDVVINISSRTSEPTDIFRQSGTNNKNDAGWNTGIWESVQGQDVFCKTLTIFGGGYGEHSVIEGNTQVNINSGGVAFQVFGGGEKGPVNGNTEINLYTGGECREIYGGGFEGDVNGHTTVNLIGGKFYDAFGGACNADVRDYTEVYIGRSRAVDGTGRPLLTGYPEGANIYGGNDFGGEVKGIGTGTEMEPDTEIGKHKQSAYEFNATTRQKDVTTIETNAYVEYYHGKVDSIAGGNYGNYEYETYYNRKKGTNGVDDPGGVAAQLHAKDPDTYGATFEFKKPKVGSSFLNIQTPQISANDRVLYFLGGSEGASDEADNDEMQSNSYVLVEAPGLNMPEDLANNYHGANVYGAGAHAGLKGGTTQVWLLKGHVKNVFGASLNEGCTENAHVYVPVGSTIHANAIFGGADGSIVKEHFESNADYNDRLSEFNSNINKIPCDATNAFVEFASNQAIIDDAIYGGNNFQRRTVNSTVNISAPVKNKDIVAEELTDLCDVYGAGYGGFTWATCTKVNLLSGAQVLDLYGGGRDGKVFETSSEYHRMMVNHTETFWDGNTDPRQYEKYDGKNPVHSETGWAAEGKFNTNVVINQGAIVVGNAFAAGKGADANVSGSSGLTLNGGTVINNIYGGGEEAPVRDRYKVGHDPQTIGDNTIPGITCSTNVKILGGRVTEVYGGGLDGDVGRGDVANKDVSGFTNITIGKLHQADPTFYNGDPTVERSLYGGGYRGKVYGTATTQMNNGHIGYKYVETTNSETSEVTGSYVENLDYDNDTRKLLKQNGNLFGAGYGEGATVDYTVVKMYDGVIRNSLYGGGEISAVGRGVKYNTTTGKYDILDNDEDDFHAGGTQVTMYGGLVQHNVFGGGRGYAIDAYGNTTSGEIGYSDGYTFGSTDVKIHGGTIGTVNAVAEGDGNVFGGGNIGHVYTGKGRKGLDGPNGEDNLYYRDPDVTSTSGDDGFNLKTKDCCVIISPYCKVKSAAQESLVKLLKDITKTGEGEPTTLYTAGTIITSVQLAALEADADVSIGTSDYVNVTMINGEYFDTEGPNAYVSTDKLNLLTANSADWDKLEREGIKIGNAVFAGGNVSRGSDKIYANTVTVHGNAVASVEDVFAKDLITLGEDGIGGLYGDGNLTLVDGYRGLNITNYGTDYYNLSDAIDYDKYLEMTDRERAYFELEYEAKEAHTYEYWECKHTHTYRMPDGNGGYKEISFKHGQKLPASETTPTVVSGEAISYGSLDYNRDDAVSVNELTEAMKAKSYWWKPTKQSTSYTDKETIKEDKYNLMDDHEKQNWERKGFCRLYAGRMINTIQRADFCGVFGSRVVMRGAQDRVTDGKSADYTEYTINRIGEVSLNKKVVNNDPHGNYFGIYNVVNYLGALTSDVPFVPSSFYSQLAAHNMSAADAKRTTDNSQSGYEPNGDSYYEWKQDNLNTRKRNDGTCHNDVAMASGVWLEIVEEPTDNSTEKKYGPITGVVELALINVATGEGGGYVYAKNEHGVLKQIKSSDELFLLDSNYGAVTYKQFKYDTPENVVTAEETNRQHLIPDKNGKTPEQDGYITTYGILVTDANGKEPGTEGYIPTAQLDEHGEPVTWHPITPKMESSGNFINSDKRIVDDCYPLSGAYMGADPSPAHYWYIRGDFYVYDQYISAYTGSAQAYAEKITIPLTITAEAQGRLTLNSVNKNLYAYWNGDLSDTTHPATNADGETIADSYKSKIDDKAVVVGGRSYHKNDPITYWDWSRLSETEQNFFVDETYTCTTTITDHYAKGDAILPTTYETLSTSNYVVREEIKIVDTSHDDQITVYAAGSYLPAGVYATLSAKDKERCITEKECFNISNAISHDNGFLLTLDWDNPEEWNKYYRDPSGNRVTSKIYDGLTESQQLDYTPCPTFRCATTGIYGLQECVVGDIIDQTTFLTKTKLDTDVSTYMSNHPEETDPTSGKVFGEFQRAYVAIDDCVLSNGHQYLKEACISAGEWGGLSVEDKSKFGEAYICTSSYLEDKTKECFHGTVIPYSVYSTYPASERDEYFQPAYICTSGTVDEEHKKWWGGELFVAGTNNAAVKYCNLPASERAAFTYNYDAFDLLSEDFKPGNENYPSDIIADGVIPLSWYEGDPDDSHHVVNGENRSVKSGEDQIPYAHEHLIDYDATYTGSTMTGDNKLKEKVWVTRAEETTSIETDQLKSGDILSNEQFGSLTNEQFKYTPIIVTPEDIANADKEYYYVVKKEFGVGETWYAPGNQISEATFENLTSTQQANVAQVPKSTLVASVGSGGGRVYFCTKKYEPITPVTDILGNYTSGEVSVGTVITDGNYTGLINEQKNFSIDGKIPNTTSTFYVAREADIDQLQQDKVVTVMYWYEYIESDEDGRSYETIRERHVINVHIHFESGVPTIGTLLPPSTVLPGQKVGLNQPTVSEGAFEVIGGGWEIYTNEVDATTHQNGRDYESGKTQVYWYQDGHYLAYYAKTSNKNVGRVYSNSVPLSVANYHRMEDVMNSTHKEMVDDGNGGLTETEVHDYMYVNKAAADVNKRDSKIYIGSSDELEAFKSLYDLSKQTANTAGFENIRNCQNLDFYLDNEIKYTGATPWTSIGNNQTNCFEGDFHGDGHAITGLQNSLFNWLCGDVYNTGVAGSFTGAGIAENGDGYVQNCWIKTTGTPTTGAGHYPVFGNPVRDAAAIAVHGVVQVENCYYPESNDYYVTYPDGYSRGKAIQKPDAAFINGEVAYNLNSFYLAQRYSDNSGKGTAGNAYWKLEDAGVDGKTPTSVKYPAENPEDINRYVESRYDNVDFLYADGIVPDVGAVNIRYNATNGKYYPIYPDDYIFFGQNLTYGLVTGGGAHDEHPTAVLKYKATEENKNSNHLLIPGKTGTRVYRAPGYYRSSDMEQVFFNPDAAFKDKYTPRADGIFGSSAQTIDIHNRLTAIDFTGYHDRGAWSDGTSQDNYFRHVLDYNGLSSFTTSGVTRNLLVYANNVGGADATTMQVLQNALQQYEPVYSESYSNDKYKKVISKIDNNDVKGHLVAQVEEWTQANPYKSSSDHFLVDKQDFNAPIPYKFNDDKRMWYQRMPDNYVGELKNSDGTYNRQAGWEGISIPFKAELVTTNDKGEITHFYSGSEESKNDTHTKIGHEYWLRHYTDLSAEADANGVRTATMRYPDAITDGPEKEVTNTFLWDYYYNETVSPHHEDQNNDTYQTYYNSTRTYSKYPRLTNGRPYIIGFPGERYYEFDLSGKFQAETTADPDPAKLEAQTISFVSAPGITIDVSDNEKAGESEVITEEGKKITYTFKPSYLNEEFEVGKAVYTLNSQGSSYDKVPETGEDKTKVAAFRPYFEVTSATAARPVTRSIVFSNDNSQLKGVEEKGDSNSEDPGRLSIYAKKHKIIVESALTRDVDIRIVNAAGITITTFNIEPGETVETRINSEGVYIVQSADGRYTKKLAVR